LLGQIADVLRQIGRICAVTFSGAAAGRTQRFGAGSGQWWV